MRRLLPYLAPAAVIAGLAAPALAQAAPPESATCTARNQTFLFWPKGHPAIPSVGFGTFTTPHMEVYKTGGYTNTNFLAFNGVGAGHGFNNANCAHNGPPRGGGPVPHAASTRRTKALRCRFPQAPQLQLGTLQGGAVTVDAVLGQVRVVAVRLTPHPRNAQMVYDRRFCRLGAPPH